MEADRDPQGYIFTWLVAYSALLGAVGGILICDYWLLRRGRLSIADLYDPAGRYRYTNGVNYRAVIALCVAVLPCVPGFINMFRPGMHDGVFDKLYTYAWFVTFAIAFTVYAALMVWHRNAAESDSAIVDRFFGFGA